MTATPKPLRVFCSYSHKDEEYANELRDWLRPLERQGFIEWWHDREISPGWEWEEAIDKNLRTADIILFLVSPALMASDYVYEKEIDKAIERHKRGEARVIPIIVRPADWEWASLGKLQALPRDANPITRWPDPDDAWLDVAKGVRRAIGELSHERQERVAKERYRRTVEQVWVDKLVTEAEAEQLSALANEVSLGEDTAANIEREVMSDTREAILERQEQAARKRAREKQLKGFYDQTRELYQNQEWQRVVGLFDQIHAEDPAYPDPEGLLASAREALEAQEQSQIVAAMYERGLRHVDAKEWQQAIESFEEVARLEPGYRDAESRLSQVRQELGRSQSVTAALVPPKVGLARTLKGHRKGVNAVAFSPDGQLVASGSGSTWGRGDDTVRLWRVQDGELLRTLEHPNVVWSAAFTPDGELLASGSRDKTVRLWRVQDGELLHTLEGHASTVRSVAFTPDGELLASGSEDKTVRLWGMR